MIQVRTTKLETFITCPYRYKHQPAPPANMFAFRFGTAVHKIIEIYVQDKVTPEAVDIIMHPFGVKDRKIMMGMVQMFMETMLKRELEYVMSEFSFTHTFEDLKDKDDEDVILEGTFDILFKTKDGKYIIVDAKTAKAERDEDHIQEANQRRIYPALFKLCSGFIIDSFEYWVMKKTIKPNIQIVPFDVAENNSEIVEGYMEDLVLAEAEGDFPTNYPNYSCWFCPLRQTCQR